MRYQYLIAILMIVFQLTACDFEKFHYYQTQQVEKLGTTLRSEVEADIVAQNDFFNSVTHQFSRPIIRLGIGQFHSEKGIVEFNRPGFFVDKPRLPWFYGVGFFQDFTSDQDQFLSIHLISDHDFTVYNTSSDEAYTALLVPNIYICDNSVQEVGLAIFPNNKMVFSDNQFHHIAQISIPVLISRGLISEPQKALCIHTYYDFKEPDFSGDKFYWHFNDIRIEPYEVQAVMDGLKAQGIEYIYPPVPIHRGS